MVCSSLVVDRLDGVAGRDRLVGGAGDDVLSDGVGADIVLGGTGDDVVIAAMDGADDVYEGGCDCDTIEASISELELAMETERAPCEFGSSGDDATWEEPSREAGDVFDYSTANAALLIDLADGRASGIEIGYDTIIGFETVIAGSGDDHFVVGPTAVSFYGKAGGNLFEFRGPGDEAVGQLVFEIHDFKAGDRVRMDKYDLFAKVFDDLENQFEKVSATRSTKKTSPYARVSRNLTVTRERLSKPTSIATTLTRPPSSSTGATFLPSSRPFDQAGRPGRPALFLVPDPCGAASVMRQRGWNRRMSGVCCRAWMERLPLSSIPLRAHILLE